jgi:hypothetical protein
MEGLAVCWSPGCGEEFGSMYSVDSGSGCDASMEGDGDEGEWARVQTFKRSSSRRDGYLDAPINSIAFLLAFDRLTRGSNAFQTT